MKFLVLPTVAYLLLVAETAFCQCVPMRGLTAAFVWLLIPWLAVTLPGSTGVVAAAIYGLLADGLASGTPGVFAGVCVSGTFALQRILNDKSLRTSWRVGAISFACSLLLSMLLTTVRLLLSPQEIDPKRLGIQLASTALGGAIIAGVASTALRPICGMRKPKTV